MTSIVSWLVGAAPQMNDPLDDRFYEGTSGRLSAAGVRVSPDAAMKIATVYRCVSILANSLAMFGMEMYEKLEKGRREADDHPLNPIISFKPNRRMSAFEFWRLVCFHLVLRQNAYAQIVPGFPGRGWVGGLMPLHPDRITGPEELSDGRLRYEYTRTDGRKFKLIGGVDIWHLMGLSSDGLKGLSMLDVAVDSFGESLASERHALGFLGRGVNFAGILQSDRTLKPDTAEAMSDSFSRKYGGGAGAGKIPVLWEGLKFAPISMTSKDAEFLDSRKWTVTEIARWFGVPPHMVGDVERSTSWGTGIEQQGLQFLIYSLQPWITLLEQSVRFTLVIQPERYYPKMNPGKLLRMDAKTQAEVFQILLQNGILNPNECRELLERNPRDGGDEYVVFDNPKDRTQLAPAAPAPPRPDPKPRQLAEGEDSRARILAEASAAELLDEEGAGLGKLANEHAKDAEGFIAAVKTFYGRFAGRVASELVCPKDAAKGWCETRRGLIIAGGLAGLMDEQQEEAEAALIALALSNGGGPAC